MPCGLRGLGHVERSRSLKSRRTDADGPVGCRLSLGVPDDLIPVVLYRTPCGFLFHCATPMLSMLSAPERLRLRVSPKKLPQLEQAEMGKRVDAVA